MYAINMKGAFHVDMWEQKEKKIHMELSTGKFWCSWERDIVAGYLETLSAGMLHVPLQPIFEPTNWKRRTSEGADMMERTFIRNTLFPAWSVQQKNFQTLTAVGGEDWTNGEFNSQAALRVNVEGAVAYVGVTANIVKNGSWKCDEMF